MYYLLFRFLIVLMGFKTPGRDDSDLDALEPAAADEPDRATAARTRLRMQRRRGVVTA